MQGINAHNINSYGDEPRFAIYSKAAVSKVFGHLNWLGGQTIIAEPYGKYMYIQNCQIKTHNTK